MTKKLAKKITTVFVLILFTVYDRIHRMDSNQAIPVENVPVSSSTITPVASTPSAENSISSSTLSSSGEQNIVDFVFSSVKDCFYVLLDLFRPGLSYNTKGPVDGVLSQLAVDHFNLTVIFT